MLTSEPQDKVHDDPADARSAHGLPFVAVIPFLSHELSVPAENRVGRHDGSQLPQCFAAQNFAFDGQQTALFVGEQDVFIALVFHQGNDLRVLKLNDLLLSAVNPARQDGKRQLTRLQNIGHGISGCRISVDWAASGKNCAKSNG